MGDISAELEDIRSAIYGEDVRGAIINSLTKVNSFIDTLISEVDNARIDGDGIIYENIGDSIRLQAEQRLQRMQYGKSTSTTVLNSNSTRDVSIIFSTPFDVVPIVMLTGLADSLALANNYGLVCLTVQNVTVDGFTARIHNGSSNNIDPSFNWMAIDMGET